MVLLMANLQTPGSHQPRSLARLSIALGTDGSGEEHQREGTQLSNGMKLSHGKGHHLMAGARGYNAPAYLACKRSGQAA